MQDKNIKGQITKTLQSKHQTPGNAKSTTMRISSLIDKFLFYCEYEKNTSPKTLENYSLRLKRLVEYIGDINIAQLKPMHILDYRIHLTQA